MASSLELGGGEAVNNFEQVMHHARIETSLLVRDVSPESAALRAIAVLQTRNMMPLRAVVVPPEKRTILHSKRLSIIEQ